MDSGGGNNDDSGDDQGDTGWWSGWDGLDDFNDYVGDIIGSTLDILIQPLNLIGDGLEAIASGLGGQLSNIFNTLSDGFNNLVDSLKYINPTHEQFILKVAFVPDSEYFQQKNALLYDAISDKFSFVNNIGDSLVAIFDAVEANEWEGIKANIPIINKELVVVSPVFVNEFAPKMRAWFGGFFVILLFAYLVREGSKMLGRGK